MTDMIGFLFFLLVAGLILVGPAILAWRIFARIARLRGDLEDLRHRVRSLEARGPAADSFAVQGPPLQPALDRPAVLPADPPVAVPVTAAAPVSAQPPPPIAPRDAESLESRIGGRWLLNIGIAAIVIGVAYFEKLAIEREWIGETAQVIQGGLVGAALIYAGSWFVRRRLAGYGKVLVGGGVAILYVSTFAAYVFYQLIGRPLAFMLMVVVTAGGAMLADRYRSQALAVLAIGGGFLTPFLLRGTGDAQTALFSYISFLVAGTVYLSRRHAWPLLNVVSYLASMIVVASWADAFYTPDKFLRTELWITLFCAMFVAIGLSSRRLASTFSEFAAWMLWTAPIAYYVASLNILGSHPVPMLVWIIAVALTGGVLSAMADVAWGAVAWTTAVLPFLAWAEGPASAGLLTEGVVTAAALYAIALASQLRRAGNDEEIQPIEIGWIHEAPLLSFAGAYLVLEDTHVAATGPAAALVAAWYAVLAWSFWTRDRRRAVHFTALAFALASIATALEFDGPAVTIGWAAEGAALLALGSLERRAWLRVGGALLFTVATLRAIDLLLSVAPANHLVLLNPRAAAGLTVVGLAYGLAWLHRRAPDDPARGLAVGGPLVVAQVVSVVLLTSEIHAFFATRDSAFTRELMVSMTWAIYATVLIVAGLRSGYALIRYVAIGLFAITIAKVFFSDLAELDRIYRVISVIGLGIMLLLTSYLYQKMRGTALGNDTARENPVGEAPR